MRESYEIVTLKTGIKSVRSILKKETFHPSTGPWYEANELHVRQQCLQSRSQNIQKFIIWDVGFGAAANAIAAIENLKYEKNLIEIYSFDKTTSAIEFALSRARDLDYLEDYVEIINQLLCKKVAEPFPHIRWILKVGDFREQLRKTLISPHSILYDPYSPSVNPEMWNLEHFQVLRKCLSNKSPCLMTCFSRSTSIRTTLLLAGFYVGMGFGIGEKTETTVASNQLQLLLQPLAWGWLNKVQNSTNSAPLKTEIYQKSKISDEEFNLLKSLPQFQSF